MKKFFLAAGLFLLSQNYYGQDDHSVVEKLTGIWVKTTHSKDTLKISALKRFELVPADVPKPQGIPAGPYTFTTLGTTMLVHWLLSSYSGAQCVPFHFANEERELSIGNFYHSDKEGEMLTFRKVN